MNKKKVLKIAVDIGMTILLLLLMGYMVTGQEAHEWLGTALFLLFIMHHILNGKWFSGLRKGKYSLSRIIQTVVNVLLLVMMIGLMISGIMLSRFVFRFLPIAGGMSFARMTHMLCSYWAFLLMSLHLGLHWGMILGMARKAGKITEKSAGRTAVLRLITLVIAIYGLYAFLKNNLLSYMLLQNAFVFFDYEQPVWQFFLEYVCMMGLWAALAYYISKMTRRKKQNHRLK